MIKRGMAIAVWLIVGHAILGALYWLLLQIPESNVFMLVVSLLIVIIMLVWAGAVQAANRLRAQAEQLGGRRRLDALDGPPQLLGQEVHEAGDHLVEEDVGDRRGQHRTHAHIPVRACDRLRVLDGWRRHRHEEVVRGRAAGLEHLDGADRRRDVVVLDGPAGVERGTVVQEVLEGPAPGQAPEEVVVGVRVGVDEARHDEKAARVDVGGDRRPREPRSHRGDPVALDEDIGTLECRRVAAEDLAAVDEERHAATSARGADRSCRAPDPAPGA